jgi:hypothetical protein
VGQFFRRRANFRREGVEHMFEENTGDRIQNPEGSGNREIHELHETFEKALRSE